MQCILLVSAESKDERNEMKTKFNDSVRESVVEARRQGKTLQAISLATGVSMTTVKKWLTDAVARNVAGIMLGL